MASPEFMSHPYMCSLCYETIVEGDHYVDRWGQKWDSHQSCHEWDIEYAFYKFTLEWKSETQLLSNLTQIVEHPAYQRIIGIGWAVVVWIIWDLTINGPDHWFPALVEITGVDAAAGEDTMAGATQKWIDWWAEEEARRRD